MLQALPSMTNSMPQSLMTSSDPSAGIPELPVISSLEMDGETPSNQASDQMKKVVSSLGSYLRDGFGKAKNARMKLWSRRPDDESRPISGT